MSSLPDILALTAGMVIGTLSLIIAALVRSGAPRATVIWGVIFCAGVCGIAVEDFLAPPWDHLAGLAATLVAGALWAFSLLLFNTERRSVVVAGPMIAIGTVFLLGHAFPLHEPMMLIHRFLMIAIGIGVAAAVWLSEGDDLDPVRRKVRRPFIGLIGAWVAITSILGALASFGLRPDAFLYVDEIGTAVLTILGGILFTAPRPGLFAAPETPKPIKTGTEEADQRLLAELDRVMTYDKAWLEEGLTVGKLAGRLGVPEHRLRPLINQELGYRNFAAFVNEHRLAEAKRRLRSQEHSAETVASIAYACGFGSLGPFGRAFKEETGMTPTAYRKKDALTGDL
jgi:AraC-like DNA-binding protein